MWHGGALWFVDIKQRHIHRFAAEVLTTWPAPAQPGWVLPTDDGGWLAGLQTGIHRFDPATGSFSLHAVIEPNLPANRLNDATADAAGRLWFGSMDDSETGVVAGFVHCHDRGSIGVTPIPPVAITNGPAFSPDGRILYHVDTRGRTIIAYDVAADGTLSGARDFVRIEPAAGNPDGPTVDAEGCVWIALWGGWAARRYSPAGELLATVRFPVANITKLAFGGEDLRTVYATTARHSLDPEALAGQPQAGHLFAFRAEVPGVAGHVIRMAR